MFSIRYFSSSVKQLSQLQVPGLEPISGPKEYFTPVRLLCWACASDKPCLTQSPEQRPPAAEKLQGTQGMRARLAGLTQDPQEICASPNWQLGLAENSKASQTVLDTSVQATELGPLSKPQHYTCQRCPAHSHVTQQSAPIAQSSKYNFCRSLSKTHETDFWFYSIALRISTKLTLSYHA